MLTLIKRICEFYCANRNIKIYFGRKKSQYIFLILKDIPIISFFNCELILRQNRKSDFFFLFNAIQFTETVYSHVLQLFLLPGFSFSQLNSMYFKKRTLHHWIKEQRHLYYIYIYWAAKTPHIFSLLLIIPTQATPGFITFVRFDFSPVSHLRAGGPRHFFGGSTSDFS